MRLFARRWIVAFGTLVLAACVSAGGAVTVLRAAPVERGAAIAWADDADSSTRNAVEVALVQHGYRITRDADAADYLIGVFIGFQERAELRADTFAGPAGISCDNFGCTSGFAWGQIGAPQVRTVSVVERTITMDLTERATHRLAWRAMSRRTVQTAHEPVDPAISALVRTLP